MVDHVTLAQLSPTSVQVSSERWAGAASFSPDGTQVAYASAGDDGINWDIRLKIVGEAGVSTSHDRSCG